MWEFYGETLMKVPRSLILLSVFTLFQSCSLLDHRDFQDEMEFSYDAPLFEPNKDFMIVAGDTGRDFRNDSEIRGRTPATAKDAATYRYDANLERELNYLESKLSPEEYEAHIEIKDQLVNVSQQIYYLQLNRHERKSYLRSRGIRADFIRTSSLEPDNQSNYFAAAGPNRAPASDDVILGMRKDDVVRNWGHPDRRDVAGDPRMENERWAYQRAGYTSYIYFEGGRVEGWNRR